MTSLLWFRRDLRLEDNPALDAALARGEPLAAVYVLDDEDAGPWRAGAASRWWLHHSLAALDHALQARGNRLILCHGPAEAAISGIAAATGAGAVFWNRRYEPWAVARDTNIKARLQAEGRAVTTCNAGLVHEPWSLRTQKGEPYRVYTPFRKALMAGVDLGSATPAPRRIPAPSKLPAGEPLADWCLLPQAPDWAASWPDTWSPGEDGAREALRRFLRGIFDYEEQRNLPANTGTSRLSPHLHFGEIGPRQVWRAAVERSHAEREGELLPGVQVFLQELVWREFAHHLLFHFPDLPDAPLRAPFRSFPWANDDAGLAAWQSGRTGYPIVDAGLRELWATGWMHNRVRMICASFLVKDLLVDWRAGERWFWDTLVDADLANNSASWQWVAGCGADAAPYFRIFNPTTQGLRFDPQGEYVRRWVPELASLPGALAHEPAKARPVDLAAAGIVLGRSYPLPMIDHGAARERALRAYRELPGREGQS